MGRRGGGAAVQWGGGAIETWQRRVGAGWLGLRLLQDVRWAVRCTVRGARCTARGARCTVRGTMSEVRGARGAVQRCRVGCSPACLEGWPRRRGVQQAGRDRRELSGLTDDTVSGETRRLSRGRPIAGDETGDEQLQRPAHPPGRYTLSPRHLRLGVHRALLIRRRRRLERGQIRRTTLREASRHCVARSYLPGQVLMAQSCVSSKLRYGIAKPLSASEKDKI